MSASAFVAMQIWRFSRTVGEGNCASSMALVPKAAMWMAAMRGASVSEAGETWRGMWVGDGLYDFSVCGEGYSPERNGWGIWAAEILHP